MITNPNPFPLMERERCTTLNPSFIYCYKRVITLLNIQKMLCFLQKKEDVVLSFILVCEKASLGQNKNTFFSVVL